VCVCVCVCVCELLSCSKCNRALTSSAYSYIRKCTLVLTFEIWGTGSSWRRPQTLFPWHRFSKVSTSVHLLYEIHYIEDFWDVGIHTLPSALGRGKNKKGIKIWVKKRARAVSILITQCPPHRPRLIFLPPLFFLGQAVSLSCVPSFGSARYSTRATVTF